MTVVKSLLSEQEKVKDYPWDSSHGHINVTLAEANLKDMPSILMPHSYEWKETKIQIRLQKRLT